MDASTDAPVDAPRDQASPPPPMICRSGAPWTTDRPAFRNDDTAGWGLTEANATGMGTGDLDGDGYPDLVVWDGGPNVRSDLDATPPVYHLRVYMNRPRTTGVGRTFVDNTRASNILALRAGGQGRIAQFAVFADIDNDGDLDVYTATSPNIAPPAGTPADPGDRAVIMLNDGHGVFAFAAESAATPPESESPQPVGAVYVDQDRDGVLDLFVGYHSDTFGLPIGQQPQLFRGHGDGTFEDVTDAVGMALETTNASLLTVTNRRPLYGVSACDVTGDGRLDLIGAAYGRQFNMLFASNDVGFTDVSVASGAGGDDNRDPSDNLSYRCYCQASPGRCPATVPAPPPPPFCPGRGWRPGIDDQPWRLNGNTFSIACGDIDNDGDIDLYTGDITHPDVGTSSDRAELLVNDGAGATVHFARPGRTATGLMPPISRNIDEGGISNGMWDFDGDGLMDIWLGGSDYDAQYGWLFHQGTDGRFTEVSRLAGYRHACPHGIALADFDLDGDVDIIQGSSTFRTFCNTQWMGRNSVRVYENIASEANWTSVRLVGRGLGGSNRNGVGARIRVTAGGVTQTREIQGPWGVQGLSMELVAHVGIGANCVIDQLEVRWPDAAGTTERFTNVPANYRLEITEGSGRVTYLQ